MASHWLKIRPEFYKEKLEGNKPFEIIDNSDRGFQKYDTVRYTDLSGEFYDDKVYQITYVTSFKQRKEYVVFGDRELKNEN